MSLIECKECQKEISSKANNCPHCGYTYKNVSTPFKSIIIIFVAIVLIILTMNIISYFKG